MDLLHSFHSSASEVVPIQLIALIFYFVIQLPVQFLYKTLLFTGVWPKTIIAQTEKLPFDHSWTSYSVCSGSSQSHCVFIIFLSEKVQLRLWRLEYENIWRLQNGLISSLLKANIIHSVLVLFCFFLNVTRLKRTVRCSSGDLLCCHMSVKLTCCHKVFAERRYSANAFT